MLRDFTDETGLMNVALDGRAWSGRQNRKTNGFYAGTKGHCIPNAVDTGEFQSDAML
jgi:hypothetical protein